jgi:small subunit ribosomal protein S8
MSWSDPIADMLTRIRNALGAGRDVVEMPHSKMKAEIARVLKHEGFVNDFSVEGGVRKELKVYLRYTDKREPAIRGLKRMSTPGLRRYVQARAVPRVLGGQGVALLSTSRGILSDREAREQGIGGELICTVW